MAKDWVTDLACYVGDTCGDETEQRKRLAKGVLETNGQGAAHWLAFLKHEETVTAKSGTTYVTRNGISLQYLADVATRELPREHLKYSDEYLEIWLILARQKGIHRPEDAHDTFKLINSQMIGTNRANLFKVRNNRVLTRLVDFSGSSFDSPHTDSRNRVIISKLSHKLVKITKDFFPEFVRWRGFLALPRIYRFGLSTTENKEELTRPLARFKRVWRMRQSLRHCSTNCWRPGRPKAG